MVFAKTLGDRTKPIKPIRLTKPKKARVIAGIESNRKPPTRPGGRMTLGFVLRFLFSAVLSALVGLVLGEVLGVVLGVVLSFVFSVVCTLIIVTNYLF